MKSLGGRKIRIRSEEFEVHFPSGRDEATGQIAPPKKKETAHGGAPPPGKTDKTRENNYCEKKIDFVTEPRGKGRADRAKQRPTPHKNNL